ncbi:MAG: Transcription elongation factor GreA [Candidatus Magasanikbacteria bacterium GW2011_GWC2_37_14]|uniref:Transcription elongation factor GreA n=1 Tax=Candidatus Magasanikbacteria bacterium GW2011_GWC2_37_14 TaxID=1619046 RepID=A0A0G0GAI6_9BACT|nr:MAG: Transcription elongation factor GreA [Candidatus Magasanikbacteria bacterium GW2011_GWC2_37_14]
MQDDIQYMSEEKLAELKKELIYLKNEKSIQLRKRIDEARQMGDLSENAEYHQAREDLSWALSRVNEIQSILGNAQIIVNTVGKGVSLGSFVKVEDKSGKEKEFTIVGAQEANPLIGKISNESPLGNALLGKNKGDKVEINTPGGIQIYKILKVG